MIATLFNSKTNKLVTTFITEEMFTQGEKLILEAADGTDDDAIVVYASQPYDIGFGLQQSVIVLFAKDMAESIHEMMSVCMN